MSFKPRSKGTTINRPDPRPALPGLVFRRKIEQAVVDPHDARERFDPDFMLGLLCEACGKVGTAPRKLVSEAIRCHVEEDCTATGKRDRPTRVRVYYPKQ